MHTVRRAIVLLTLGAALALGAATTSEPTPYVMAVRLEGMVDDGMTVLVTRAVREAAGAKALVFIIDTPGGLVDSAINHRAIIDSRAGRSRSSTEGALAAALISYACDDIDVAFTNMGAAQPVT